MEFINRNIWLWTLAGLVFAISSCGSLPSGDSSNPIKSEDGEIVETPRIIQPNPYLANAPRVSGPVESTFNSGLNAMESENWAEAELIFKELTVTEPNLSGPWVNLGIIHNKTGKPEIAESDWTMAIQLNPYNFDAYNQLAILKREQGDFSAAETIFQNSLAKWPDNAEAHCNLGILYDLYMGLWAQALTEYRECADLTEEPSRQLRGWIIDMERRIQSQVAN